jgi:phosphoribosylformylglycinamidine synthase
MQMFWNGQKIVDLSRAFLDTSGCSKESKGKIAHLQEVNSNSIEFNEENFYKILAEKYRFSKRIG